MPIEPGEPVFIVLVGGGLAALFFLAVRDFSVWLLSKDLLPLVLLLWAVVGCLTIRVIIGWLTPQGE